MHAIRLQQEAASGTASVRANQHTKPGEHRTSSRVCVCGGGELRVQERVQERKPLRNQESFTGAWERLNA
eukprot:360633-Chlamydomonas_euryale.AAC.14